MGHLSSSSGIASPPSSSDSKRGREGVGDCECSIDKRGDSDGVVVRGGDSDDVG